MKIINIHSAKTHLSRLVENVRQGEEIIIAKAGKPMAKMIAYQASAEPRKPGGSWRGKVRIAKDFDELPEEITTAFQGKSV